MKTSVPRQAGFDGINGASCFLSLATQHTRKADWFSRSTLLPAHRTTTSHSAGSPKVMRRDRASNRLVSRLRVFRLGGRDTCGGARRSWKRTLKSRAHQIDAPPERVGTFLFDASNRSILSRQLIRFRKAGGRDSSASAAHGRILWMDTPTFTDAACGPLGTFFFL